MLKVTERESGMVALMDNGVEIPLLIYVGDIEYYAYVPNCALIYLVPDSEAPEPEEETLKAFWAVNDCWMEVVINLASGKVETFTPYFGVEMALTRVALDVLNRSRANKNKQPEELDMGSADFWINIGATVIAMRANLKIQPWLSRYEDLVRSMSWAMRIHVLEEL